MNKILFLFMLLIPISAKCVDKRKPKLMPVSRWREIQRMKTDSTIVPFTDTLFIWFKRKDTFQYNVKNGFIYKGVYTINEDSILDFGTARYKIVERMPLKLVLTSVEGIFHFIRDSSDTAKVIVLDKEEKLLPITNIDQMIGKWSVYRREVKEKASGQIDNSQAVRTVYITGPSTDGKQGYVFSGTDPRNKWSWYIKSLGTDQVLDCDGKNKRILKVIKCQNGEMILEDDGIKYYLKQFK